MTFLEAKKRYYENQPEQLRTLKLDFEVLEAKISSYLNQEVGSRQTLDLDAVQKDFATIKSGIDRLVIDLGTNKVTDLQAVETIRERVNAWERAKKQFNFDVKFLIIEVLEKINAINNQWQEFIGFQTSTDNVLQARVNTLPITIKKYNILDQIADFYQTSAPEYAKLNNYLFTGRTLFDLSKTATQTKQTLLAIAKWDNILLTPLLNEKQQGIEKWLKAKLANNKKIKARDQELKAVNIKQLKRWNIVNFRKQPDNVIPQEPSDWSIENGELKVTWKSVEAPELEPTTHSFKIDDLIAKQNQKWYENAIWFEHKEITVVQPQIDETLQQSLKEIDFWEWMKSYVEWVIQAKQPEETFKWLYPKLQQMKNKRNFGVYLIELKKGRIELQKDEIGMAIKYWDSYRFQNLDKKVIDLKVLAQTNDFNKLNAQQYAKLEEFVQLNNEYENNLKTFIEWILRRG